MRHMFQSAMRQMAAQATSDKQGARLGQVTSADPANHAVKVAYQPENVESGWLPFGCIIFGPGSGVFALPANGAQVAVDHEFGDPEAGVVQHCLADTVNPPPAGYQAGEYWVVLANGVTLKLTNDGKVTIQDAHGASVVLNNDGTASITANTTITGTLHVTQNLTCDQTVTGTVDVVGAGKSLKGHTHLVEHVQGGSATIPTDPPT